MDPDAGETSLIKQKRTNEGRLLPEYQEFSEGLSK